MMDFKCSLFCPDDDWITEKNKESIIKVMKSLQNSGKLVSGSFKENYELVGPPIHTDSGDAIIFKVIDKNDNSPNPQVKALTSKPFSLHEKLKLLQQIELLAKIDHPNVIRIEKVFFEFDEDRCETTINLITPWIDNTLITWLTKSPTCTDFRFIPENQRTFEEVQHILCSTLEGIHTLHMQDILLLDIKPDNILIREPPTACEFGNKTNKFSAVISELGTGKNLFKLTKGQISGKKGFIAPEIVDYADKMRLEASRVQESNTIFENSIYKKKFFTPKADIFAFGVMLFKLFIKEDTDYPYQNMITSENIKTRINKLFNPKPTISEAIIEDLKKIVESCLTVDPIQRPDSLELLCLHPFFDSKQKDAWLNDCFLLGLKFLEGKCGLQKDLKKATAIFEKLSSTHKWAPATFFHGFALSEGSPEQRKMGFVKMGESAAEYKAQIESDDDPLGVSSFALGIMRVNGFGVEKDLSIALSHFEESARKNNSLAQREAGVMYHQGLGTEKNYSKALKYFELAAEQDNSDAYNWLGRMYHNGEGVGKNYLQAAVAFLRSAVLGDPVGTYWVGTMHYFGKGLKKDSSEALKYFKWSAEQGNAEAQCYLGTMFYNGEGTETNYSEASKYLKLSAEQGNSEAYCWLGGMYYDGKSTERDYSEALKYFKLSAELGDAKGQCWAGTMYYRGLGTETDYSAAKRYFELSAEQGNTQAQSNLRTLNFESRTEKDRS